MIVLNLGCGTKTCDQKAIINIDWSPYLRIKRNPILRRVAPCFLNEERRRRLENLPDNIMVHDLSKGIPFEDSSVDAVYHSHLFEHLDREVGVQFAGEVLRVLKPRGIHRMVMPDFEFLAEEYIAHAKRCADDPEEVGNHDEFIARMIEQCVRTEGYGTVHQQSRFKRTLDRLLFGDARARGEVHRWMYDRHTLGDLLEKAGYERVAVKSHDDSEISDWNEFALEIGEDGGEYKPRSLYIEARKPA